MSEIKCHNTLELCGQPKHSMSTQCHHPCNSLSKCITKRQKDAKGHDTDHECHRKSSAVPGWHMMAPDAQVLSYLHRQRMPKLKNQRCLQLQQRILIQKNSSNLTWADKARYWISRMQSNMSSKGCFFETVDHNLEGLTRIYGHRNSPKRPKKLGAHTAVQRLLRWPSGISTTFPGFPAVMGYPWQ